MQEFKFANEGRSSGGSGVTPGNVEVLDRMVTLGDGKGARA